MTHNMETHSLTWFIISLSAACIAFGIVMWWFQEMDEKKARKRYTEESEGDLSDAKIPLHEILLNQPIMTTWEKLSVSQPKHKGRKYDVLISVNGKYIEDTLTWTTLAMWNSEKVAYWRER